MISVTAFVFFLAKLRFLLEIRVDFMHATELGVGFDGEN